MGPVPASRNDLLAIIAYFTYNDNINIVIEFDRRASDRKEGAWHGEGQEG